MLAARLGNLGGYIGMSHAQGISLCSRKDYAGTLNYPEFLAIAY